MYTAIRFTPLLDRYDGALLVALCLIRRSGKIVAGKRRCDDLFNAPSPAVDAYHNCLPAHDDATRALAHLPAPTPDSAVRYPIFGAYRATTDDEAATCNTYPFDQHTPGSANIRPHTYHLAHPGGFSAASKHASCDIYGAAQDFSVRASSTNAESTTHCADADSGPYSSAAGLAIIPDGRLVPCLFR